jgi:hypothetical protein
MCLYYALFGLDIYSYFVQDRVEARSEADAIPVEYQARKSYARTEYTHHNHPRAKYMWNMLDRNCQIRESLYLYTVGTHLLFSRILAPYI